jgi:hypothetical protein
MSALGAAERLLGPFDGARRRLWGETLRVGWLAPWLVRRDRRLAAQSTIGAAALFALTLAAPGALYVLGPALFGVAHVASDVRYLVLRRDVPRGWARLALFASAALVAARAAPLAGLGFSALPRFEVLLGAGWALAGALYGARVGGGPWRGLAVGAPLLALGAAAWRAPGPALLAFAYAHNLVALVLWVALFRRRRAFAWPALALALGGAAALASGAAAPPGGPAGPWGARLAADAAAALPSAPAAVALGVALSFVFLQALHYSVWLAWVPQEDLRGEGTLSFRMSLRSLARDFGPVALAVVAALCLLVAGASLVAPHRTRHVYLSLAAFHAHLELASLAFLLARGRRPSP